jgi:hypothetical protein
MGKKETVFLCGAIQGCRQRLTGAICGSLTIGFYHHVVIASAVSRAHVHRLRPSYCIPYSAGSNAHVQSLLIERQWLHASALRYCLNRSFCEHLIVGRIKRDAEGHSTRSVTDGERSVVRTILVNKPKHSKNLITCGTFSMSGAVLIVEAYCTRLSFALYLLSNLCLTDAVPAVYSQPCGSPLPNEGTSSW